MKTSSEKSFQVFKEANKVNSCSIYSHMQRIVVRGIKQKKICYLAFKTQEKLYLLPCHANAQPIKFHRFFINDLKQAIKNRFPVFVIDQQWEIISFKIDISEVVSNENLVYQKGTDTKKWTQLLTSFFQGKFFELIDAFVRAHGNRKLKAKSPHYSFQNNQSQIKTNPKKTFIAELLARKKINLIQRLLESPANISKKLSGQQFEKQDNDSISSVSQVEDRNWENAIKSKRLPQILEIETDEANINQKFIGGVSVVEKVLVSKMTYTFDEQKIEATNCPFYLMKKMRKQSFSSCTNHGVHEENAVFSNIQSRFNREPEIIQNLNSKGHKPYLLHYFDEKSGRSSQRSYYVEYAEMNLSDFLQIYRSKLGYRELIKLSLEVVRIVRDLHQSKYVHRDLKPQNFLVKKEKENKFSLKLIDFSDSAEIRQRSDDEELAAKDIIFGTIPYSPIETEKSNINYKKKGLNNKEIDYWSVGVLISLIFEGCIPVSFCPHFWKEVNALWERDFMMICRHKNSHNINYIDEIVARIVANTVQVKQQRRMNLQKVEQILCVVLEYYQNLLGSQLGLNGFQDIGPTVFEYF